MIRSKPVRVRWQDMTRAALLPAVFLLFLVGSAFGQVQYAITDLGTLGGGYSCASGINESGQVVGDSYTSTGSSHAFLYSGTSMQDLGILGGTYSTAYGINDSGQVVGWVEVAGQSGHAFLYTGSGSMQDLGTLGDNAARGINNSGQVVGYTGGNEFLNVPPPRFPLQRQRSHPGLEQLGCSVLRLDPDERKCH